MIVRVASFNSQVKIPSALSAPLSPFSKSLSSQWACLPSTCGTGSWCWWWRRAFVEDATSADSCVGSASCIFHTDRKKKSYLKNKNFPNICILGLGRHANSHGRAFLQCGYGGGSSVSAGAGSAFHRFRMDMASHPCGLTHGHGDEQPAEKKKTKVRNNKIFSQFRVR